MENSEVQTIIDNDAKREAKKALKWIIRSGTAQTIVGTIVSGIVGILGIFTSNPETARIVYIVAIVAFIANLISCLGQGVINYLDYLNHEKGI